MTAYQFKTKYIQDNGLILVVAPSYDAAINRLTCANVSARYIGEVEKPLPKLPKKAPLNVIR